MQRQRKKQTLETSNGLDRKRSQTTGEMEGCIKTRISDRNSELRKEYSDMYKTGLDEVGFF